MNIFLLIILYLGFISLGLPDQILGVAWPDIRKDFSLPLDFAGILIITTSICTTISSFLSGYLLRKFPIANILITSALLTAFALTLYGLSTAWWMIVFVTIPLGLGAGAVDSVLNDYVSKNLTSRHMNWLHGFWGVGATLGPAIMTASICATKTWRLGYIVIGIIQFLLFLLFVFTRKMWKKVESKTPSKEKINFNLFSPAPFMSVLFFFVYTALEGSIGVWFYSVMVEDRGIPKELAGIFIVLYWCSLTVGRFINGWLSTRLNCSKVITYSVFCAFVGILLMLFNNTFLILVALIITGASLSGIYPCMLFETASRFDSKTASILTGYQVGFACLGYALLIPLVGFILDKVGLFSFMPLLLIMCLALLLLDRLLHKILKKSSKMTG